MANSKARSWGFMIGAAAGLAIALLKAPQAGEKTRAQLEAAGTDLTRRAAEVAGTAGKQALDSAQPALSRVGQVAERADELVSRGRSLLEERRRAMRNGHHM